MPRPLLLVTGALVTGGCVGIAALPDPVAAFPTMIAFLAPATVAWAWAAARVGVSGPSSRGDLRFVLLVSLLARIALLVPPVPLSDDLYRYLWDGRIGNAGIDPFRHAPAAVELAAHRDARIWPHINHPDVPTIYPPVAQIAFRAMDAVSGDPRAPRAAATLFDLATVLLLAGILRRRSRPPAAALLYGWCPLAVLESGGGGHVDALGVALLAAALAAHVRSTSGGALAAGVLLALSSLVKPVAPLLAPALLVVTPARDRGRLLLGGAIGLLPALPYLRAGEHLFTGLLTYAEHWRFNDAIYSPLVSAGLAPRTARVALAAVAVLFACVAPLRRRDALAVTPVILGVTLLLSPTVHPWYAVWLAALLPFASPAFAPGAGAFLALLPATYVSAWQLARGGEWVEPLWTRLLVWGVPVALIFTTTLRAAAGPREPRGRSSPGS